MHNTQVPFLIIYDAGEWKKHEAVKKNTLQNVFTTFRLTQKQ